MSMSDHTKGLSRAVEDARERSTQVEKDISKISKELENLKGEQSKLNAFIDSASAIINSLNSSAGGQSAIVLPEKLHNHSR